MIEQPRDVAVIIAAWNAATTIGRAVQSALIQAEVREIVVVDDGSDDGTVEFAKAADDGSGRLTIVQQGSNRGPSAARNRAIELTRAPYIAVLDGDDFFLPNRFESLFANGAFDMIADNIVFVREGQLNIVGESLRQFEPAPETIGLAGFIAGNVSRPGRARAELGFVKPLISRAFIDRAAIRYDESLRLGEDFALYAQILAAGAKFVRIRSCGYVAVERDESLSGCHQTSDLEALLRFDESFYRRPGLSENVLEALKRHRRQLVVKVHHRQVLDRRKKGILPAITAALGRPGLLPQLALSVARDKLAGSLPAQREVRYLFD